MKKSFTIRTVILQLFIVSVIFFSAAPHAAAQSGVKIAASAGSADPSAMLDVESTSKGFLIPRMTAAQRIAIASPASGLMVYQTDGTPSIYYNAGTPSVPSWTILSAGQLSGAGNVNYLTKWTAFSPNGVIGNSAIYDNGNVGIANTSPAQKLQIGAGNNDGITIGNYNDQLGWNGSGTAPKYALRFPGYRDVVNNFTGAMISAERTNLCCSGLSQATELAFYTQEGTATVTGDGNLTERLRIGNGGVKVTGRLYGPGIASYAVARSQSGFTPPTSQSAANGSANEIPGLSVTIVTHGGDLELDGTLFLSWGVVGARGAFSASIDGQWVGAFIGSPWPTTWSNWYDGIIGMYAGANWDTRSYHRVVTNVPAGTHTVKLLAWNETANGWSINCCSMVSEFTVKELLKQN